MAAESWALLIDTFPLTKSQSSYAGGNVFNRIFILLTKIIHFILGGGGGNLQNHVITLFRLLGFLLTLPTQSWQKGTKWSLSTHSFLVGSSMNAWLVSLSPAFPNCFLPKICIGSGLLGSFYQMPLGSHGRGVIKISHQIVIPSQNWKKTLLSEFIKRQNAVYLNDSAKQYIHRAQVLGVCWTRSFPMTSNVEKWHV